MLTAHTAVALAQLGKDHAIHREVIQTDGRGSDIDDGVHRSRLVKMHQTHVCPVNSRLRLRQHLENPVRDGLGPVRHGRCRENPTDLIRSPSVGMRMGV